MKIIYPAIVLKNYSFLFSGVLGIVFGFAVSIMVISYREHSEEIISIGDLTITNSTKSPTVSNKQYTELSRVRARILCMVISALEWNGRKAVNVNNTWGRRCDKLIFLTSRRAYDLNTVLIPEILEDNRDTLWDKVSYGFSYALATQFDFDWFLKADDDTYVVMENLRMVLRGYSPRQGLYFGCRILRKHEVVAGRFTKADAHVGYMSGGAGYVLSREALRLFDEQIKTPKPLDSLLSWAEDINMAIYLKRANVTFVDTRDEFGRTRFHPLNLKLMGHVRPKLKHNYWYYQRHYYHINDGPNCCAESTITFHYVASPLMDLMEFFLYHLSPYQH